MYFYTRLNPRLSSLLNLTRWLAAELVLLGHLRALTLVKWSAIPIDQRNPGLWLLFALSSLAHQAVVLFFVLSGFLVGGSVVSDLLLNRFEPRRYFVHRLSRLYVVLPPALALGWLLDWLGARLLANTGIYTHTSSYDISILYYDISARMSPRVALSNALNLQTILTRTLGSNSPLWSLAYEFWYYAFFPALILPFVSRRAWQKAAWGVAAAAIGWLIYPTILSYALIWLLGVAIRLVPRIPVPRPWVTAAAVLVVGGACARATAKGPQWLPFIADLIVALVFLVFLLSAMYDRAQEPLPGAAVHERLAGFSYSLYLLHFPFILLTLTWAESSYGVGLAQQPRGASSLVLGLVFLLANIYAWLVSLLTERHTETVRRFLLSFVATNKPKPTTESA